MLVSLDSNYLFRGSDWDLASELEEVKSNLGKKKLDIQIFVQTDRHLVEYTDIQLSIQTFSKDSSYIIQRI